MSLQVGTFGYMAPELTGLVHDEDTDLTAHRATLAVDIYGFGKLMWNIITGEYKCGSINRSPR